MSVEQVKEDLNLFRELSMLAIASKDGRTLMKSKFTRIMKYIESLEEFYKVNAKGKPLDKFIDFGEGE